MIDCHVHSTFSPDSEITFAAGVESAKKTGLKGFIFTDHYEHDYALTSAKLNFDFDIKDRERELNELQLQHDGSLKILHGLELGIHSGSIETLSNVVNQNNLDFVIASIHELDREAIGCPEFYQGKSKSDAFNRYLEGILYSVTNFKDYDVIGHIGFVRRYAPFEDKNMHHVDYQDRIDEILKKVIESGKGIEVNSSGLRQGLGTPIPAFDILRRYFELGGSILTLGSDSHKAENMGQDFKLIAEQLKVIGFKQATYFSKREPIFYNL